MPTWWLWNPKLCIMCSALESGTVFSCHVCREKEVGFLCRNSKCPLLLTYLFRHQVYISGIHLLWSQYITLCFIFLKNLMRNHKRFLYVQPNIMVENWAQTLENRIEIWLKKIKTYSIYILPVPTSHLFPLITASFFFHQKRDTTVMRHFSKKKSTPLSWEPTLPGISIHRRNKHIFSNWDHTGQPS